MVSEQLLEKIKAFLKNHRRLEGTDAIAEELYEELLKEGC